MSDIEIKPKIRVKKIYEPLKPYYYEESKQLEIGVDEAGRGPLFGRVYAGAVILPKDDSFDHSQMKDSKRFTSKKKINEVAEYIKSKAIVWHVSYSDEKYIDKYNILKATHEAMHQAIKGAIYKSPAPQLQGHIYNLLIDGNCFKPYTFMKNNSLQQMPHICIEGGDNKYSSIAAASILAKVTRDKYIQDICDENPTLDEYYSLKSNQGYGTQKHRDGIKLFGITPWHRKSFGICRSFC